MFAWSAVNPLYWLALILFILFVVAAGAGFYYDAKADRLEEKVKVVQGEFDAYVSTHKALAAEAERQAQLKLEEQQRATSEIEATYAGALRATADNLDAVLKRMRVYQARAGNRKPAEAAPAECRTYDASPTQLSQPDREFLAGIGAEADNLANQVNALQKYIKEITK